MTINLRPSYSLASSITDTKPNNKPPCIPPSVLEEAPPVFPLLPACPPNTLAEVLCTGVGISLGFVTVFDDEVLALGRVVVTPVLTVTVVSPPVLTAGTAAEVLEVLIVVGVSVTVP